MRFKTCLFAVVLFGTCAPFSSQRLWSQAANEQTSAIASVEAPSTLPDAPDQKKRAAAQPATNASNTGALSDAGDISGTVTDVNGDLVPGATVQIESAGDATRRSQSADDNGFFEFKGTPGGRTYRMTVSANGFEPWVSEPLAVASGQFLTVPGIKLKLAGAVSSVTVVADPVQIATEQVHIEEQQRVLGIIPNFYVVYDAKDAAPLTTKLKFQLAYKVSVDAVSIVGAAMLAGMNQAGDTPNFQQGWKGYGQRFGAAYGDGVIDIMFGGAILPSLLHQDPRYFHQGTGTTRSRMIHALSAPFICRGDNGDRQVNYSSLGGDLITSAISTTYYPQSNRNASFVVSNFILGTGARELSTLMQEFVLRKLTPAAKRHNPDSTY